MVGLAIYIFSVLAPLWVVHTLGRFLSGKVLIAPGHRLVVPQIFRALKHPNYLLNMILRPGSSSASAVMHRPAFP